jgi:hypothetical protein
MTMPRLVMWGFVVLLVVLPCLGFAAGEPALHIWNKHPRHASGHDGGSRVVWKPTPGTLNAPPPAQVLALMGRLSPPPLRAVTPPLPRPPFVPPRV